MQIMTLFNVKYVFRVFIICINLYVQVNLLGFNFLKRTLLQIEIIHVHFKKPKDL